MSERLRLGISTCPNDTFTFHGLLTGAVQVEGAQIDFELLDVQELNEGFARGEFDAAKVSFHAALRMADELWVLRVGSALGRGVGPLVLAAAGAERGADARVLCPGQWTTASLLCRLFHPEWKRIEQVCFSEIMPALAAGKADLGVCIHEGRFTWKKSGLERVEDLGQTWERATAEPLPLGGIVARNNLEPKLLAALQTAIVASLDYAREHPSQALQSMREHAQELSDAVLWQHVELYVNDSTRDLGPGGQRALLALAERAKSVGLMEPGSQLKIFPA